MPSRAAEQLVQADASGVARGGRARPRSASRARRPARSPSGLRAAERPMPVIALAPVAADDQRLPEVLVGPHRRDHAAAAPAPGRSTSSRRSAARHAMRAHPSTGKRRRRLSSSSAVCIRSRTTRVDLVDVGVVAELRDDVDRVEHLRCGSSSGSGRLGGNAEGEAEREAEGHRDVLRAQPLLELEAAWRSARRGRGGSGPPGRRCSRPGTIGTPAAQRRAHVARAAVEVDRGAPARRAGRRRSRRRGRRS